MINVDFKCKVASPEASSKSECLGEKAEAGTLLPIISGKSDAHFLSCKYEDTNAYGTEFRI